jgi:hypothetical protein
MQRRSLLGQLGGAVLVTLVGMGITTVGAFGHQGGLMAPGSLLILLGSGWAGYALARLDVRPFPTMRRPVADGDGR